MNVTKEGPSRYTIMLCARVVMRAIFKKRVYSTKTPTVIFLKIFPSCYSRFLINLIMLAHSFFQVDSKHFLLDAQNRSNLVFKGLLINTALFEYVSDLQ